MSWFIAGVGQIYIGQTAKGVVLLVAEIILAPTTFGVMYFVLGLVTAIDAYKQCKLLNEQEKIGPWTFFSQTNKK